MRRYTCRSMTKWYISDVMTDEDVKLYVASRSGVVVGRWRDVREALKWVWEQSNEGDELVMEVSL